MATLEDLIKKANSTAVKQHHDSEEHRIQTACVRWFRFKYPNHRHNLFAVPNGQKRTSVQCAWLKEEGMLPGVADLILLKSNSNYGALLVEMKTAKGKQQKNQKEWQSLIEKDGYKYVVCRSTDDFIRYVTDYMNDIYF